MRRVMGMAAASAMLAVAALTGGAVISTGASADGCTAVADSDGYLGSAASPQQFKILSYEYVKGVGTLRNEDPDGNGTTLRQEHLAWEKAWKAECKAVNIGATGTRENKLDRDANEAVGALVIFRGSVTEEEITSYAMNDPYYVAGLIKKFEIISPWTVVG